MFLMNEQQEEAYRYQMEYHKIDNKFLLKIHLARLSLLQGLASKVPLPGWAARLHRMRGVKIGRNVFIGDNVHLDVFHPNLITIEDNVSIGMRTMIFAHRSHWSPFLSKIYPKMTAPVVLGKGSWIAPGCIILPGVKIGTNSVVGAGSVVIKDVEPYSVVAGSPAKFIKKVETSPTNSD
jgi:acetyltransferase-like isoleucine patch superfamily enzyme